MDPLFSIQKRVVPNILENTSLGVSCSISSSGILAFSSSLQLLPCEFYFIYFGIFNKKCFFPALKNEQFGHFVYVADINAPWRIYCVSSFRTAVNLLKWDASGKILVTADSNGDVKLWMMKDFLISQWVQVASAAFAGENVIAAEFFHKGTKIQYVNEKMELNSYLEKFSRIRFPPSVRKFGGVGVNGMIFVTSTGMLGAFQIPPEGFGNGCLQDSVIVKLETVTESLGLTRNYYTCADISYSKRQFLIAVANGENNKSVIQGFRVQIELQNDKLSISSSSLPSFFQHEGAGSSLNALNLIKLKWAAKEDPDTLLVTSNHASGTLIESWKLKEQSKTLKKVFQANKNDGFKTLLWTPATQFHHNSHTDAVVVCQAPSGPSCLYTSTSDGIIHCLRLDSLKEICKVSTIQSQPQQSDESTSNANKMMKLSPMKVKALATTFMGHMVLALDNQGTINAYRCSFMLREPSLQYLNYPGYIVSALEYSMINGNDFFDILLNIKPQTSDAIVEKLNENFNRQHSSVQQYYYVAFLVAKINVYRLSNQGQTKAQDLNNLLMLHSILIAFKSLLRPSDLTSHEGPAEQLALVLSESVPDVDKVLLNLEAKDFTVETIILQSLKQLIQWVADLALNILSRLSETRQQAGKTLTGYDISKDIVALNSIRELLVMIRIWGLFKPQCLPTFTRSSDSQDILSTIFRLLTKLALNPNEPDELLIDECCALPSQVLIPNQVQYNPPRCGLLVPNLQSLSLPLFMEYNNECENLYFQPEMTSIGEGSPCEIPIDSVRYLLFGSSCRALRKCTRCGSYTSLNSIARTSATKAWEQRWICGCRCGGFWRLVDE